MPNGTDRYPGYVTSPAEKRRWDLCRAIVADLFEEPESAALSWQATRTLYNSRIPTDAEDGGSVAGASRPGEAPDMG